MTKKEGANFAVNYSYKTEDFNKEKIAEKLGKRRKKN